MSAVGQAVMAYAAGKGDALQGRAKDPSWAQTDHWGEYARGYANHKVQA